MTEVQTAQPIYMRSLLEIDDWQNMVIYGSYGSGKTYLAGTAVLVPEMSDVLYLSLEGGEKTLKTLKKVCTKNKIDPNCLQVIPIQTFSQYANVYEFLKLHVQFRDANDLNNLRRLEAQITNVPNSGKLTNEELEKLIPKPKKFKTVITDSLTEAQKYCMYQLLGINVNTQRIDQRPDKAEWDE